jgi:serine protein kinase
MTPRVDIVSMVRDLQDVESYRELTWEGTFQDYIDIVIESPKVTRTSFQRVYDMILSYGTEEYTEYKKRIVHYKFFDDPMGGGHDAVYGLDIPLMKLVNIFKSAAKRYGTERRVILLHGPVGSSKSTIARLLKKGLEE